MPEARVRIAPVSFSSNKGSGGTKHEEAYKLMPTEPQGSLSGRDHDRWSGRLRKHESQSISAIVDPL